MNSKKNEVRQTEERYANNPVMLYQTLGIQEYGYDNRWKGEYSGAVRLEGEDLVRAIAFLKDKFDGDIVAVLYINAPEATEQNCGQPALLPLTKKDGKYYALGVSGSYSVPLF